MSKKYFMGIDIGTYESKGVIIDSAAKIIAYHKCPHNMESPYPGYAEHDAKKTWWSDFCELSNELISRSGVSNKDIEAVGVSTIAPCCLPVNKDLEPLRKAILYGVDVRAVKEIDQINELMGEEEIFKRCGTAVTSQSAAAKILWIKNNEPDIYDKTYKFITGATYLTAKLTGSYYIDHYTAATWVPVYDVDGKKWVDDLGLFCRKDQLAECAWSHEVIGIVTKDASAQTGLMAGTKVITGTADASAEAISVGVLDAGDMMIMYGSSIFMIHVVKEFTRDKRLWAGPFLFPDTFSVAAGMSTAGTLTRWFRDNFSRELLEKQKKDGINAYDVLADSISEISPGSDGLIVLPYFSGERTPINDPKAKGVIFGLHLLHTREHIYNACLEGIGYGIAQHFDIFRERNIDTHKVMAVGGGTKTEKWLQIVSDISGQTQHVARQNTGAAYGDALLAALGTGYYRDTKDISALIQINNSVVPDQVNTEKYQLFKEKYSRIYTSTRDIMHDL